jgi:RNA polymerase sigma-70 factor (ECF subfamily)
MSETDIPNLPPGDARHPAFLRLYAQHEHEIFSYIVALVGNWTDANDVMQDTSVALWNMFPQFDPGTSFKAWACQVAHYRVLRFRQKCSRDRHVFDPELVEQLREVAADEVNSFDSRRMALENCVNRLEPHQRDLLHRCYAEGARIRTVAQELQRPEKAVYKVIAHIRKSLLDCIRLRLREEGIDS